MNEHELYVYKSIVGNMREGVLTVDMRGHITTLNESACRILSLDINNIGKFFGKVFFEFKENDAFVQTILDAVYGKEMSHNDVVDYYDGNSVKRLFINTSYLINNSEKIGLTVVINDITELVELQNAVKAMEKIRELNVKLEQRNTFIKKTFGRYLSDDIVELLLDTNKGLQLGGEKQVVSIMFSDLRGFTAISEIMEPSELIHMLNHYLSVMIEVVQHHRGTILEFIGDAVLAVFGAPVATDDYCYDAVACAIEMQCTMEEINKYNRENGWHELEMGIGIHTGEVVLGNIGSEKKTKYGIVGKNVNLASRIETYTVGGQILISSTTRASLGHSLMTISEQQIMPKGVKTPMTIYEIGGIGEYVVPSRKQHFNKLEQPIEIGIRRIHGKSAEVVGSPAKVIEVSEKEAIVLTKTQYENNENILFSMPHGDVYAKVVETGKRTKIHLTMGEIKQENIS